MGRSWPYAVLALLVLVVPVAGSWYAAREWSREAEFEQTQLMALTIRRRSESIAKQADDAAERLKAARGTQPCSGANMALMREIALDSSHVLAVGYVDGDRLVCSSLGMHTPPISLGPPGFISPTGLEIHPALRLPLARGRHRLVGVRDGTAVVLAPELIAELYPGQRDIVIGVATQTGVKLA